MTVIEHIAGLWRRNVKALARLAPRIAAAIDGGWLPDRLKRHLADSPPPDMGDGVGVLRYRLNRLPACPDECGRACCAQREPAPAICFGCRNPIPLGETCIWCEINAEAEEKRARLGSDERRQAEVDRRQRLAELAERLGPQALRAVTGRNAGIESGYVRGKLMALLDEHGGDVAQALAAVAGSGVQPPPPAVTTA